MRVTDSPVKLGIAVAGAVAFTCLLAVFGLGVAVGVLVS